MNGYMKRAVIMAMTLAVAREMKRAGGAIFAARSGLACLTRACLAPACLLLACGAAWPADPEEEFVYEANWRLIDAGRASMAIAGGEVRLELATHGVVGSLYKVHDAYAARFGEGWCAAGLIHSVQRAKKEQEIRVTFQEPPGTARRVDTERDTEGRQTRQDVKEIGVPRCVHDVMGALMKVRETGLAVGRSMELPISDGRKSVNARVEAQKRERVATPAGEFAAVRYEAFLYNGVLFQRKARLYFWLTDDEKRRPVQIQVDLPFYIGDVTLRLAKAGESAPLLRVGQVAAQYDF
jgi:hypothetical protein